MKSLSYISLAAVALGLAGCATSPPVELGAVGPNPGRIASQEATGQLEVFSALEQSEPVAMNLSVPEGASDWSAIEGVAGSRIGYQHTDYDIYNLNGQRVEHVLNVVNTHESTPRLVSLPPGRYIVEAKARDAKLVRVPVEIARGLTSRVHLDDNWKRPAHTHMNELVSLPSGRPVGWRADIQRTGLQTQPSN